MPGKLRPQELLEAYLKRLALLDDGGPSILPSLGPNGNQGNPNSANQTHGMDQDTAGSHTAHPRLLAPKKPSLCT